MKTRIMQIVPSDILQAIDGREMYMCLTNVAINDENYLQFYIDKVNEGKFVLLDNGTGDLDYQTMDKVLEIAKKLKPTEIILSDILGDCEQTLIESEKSKKYFRENGYTGQFMFVPQGQNLDEWIDCYNRFDKTDVATIGVSKFVTKFFNDDQARLKCTKYVEKDNVPVHLLGCWKNINEVVDIAKQCSNVRSSDSAICYIYAISDMLVGEKDRPDNKIDFYHSVLNDKQLQTLKENIDIYDKKIQFEEQ